MVLRNGRRGKERRNVVKHSQWYKEKGGQGNERQSGKEPTIVRHACLG